MDVVAGYAAWCRLPEHPAADGSVEEAAWERVQRLVWKDPVKAADTLMRVINALSLAEVEALALLGADALEDLLKEAPERWLPLFVARAEQDDRAAIAMSAVWMDAPWDHELSELRQRTGQPTRG